MRHFKRKEVSVPTSVISEALSKVLKDGLSVRLSAKEHGIPKSTLQRYVNKNQEHGDTSPLSIEKLGVKGFRTVRFILKFVELNFKVFYLQLGIHRRAGIRASAVSS